MQGIPLLFADLVPELLEPHASGFPLAVQNTGNNVIIQNGTVQEMGYGVLLTSEWLFGQAFSLDGYSFTPKGYGLVTNVLIDTVNAHYGSRLPHVRTADLPGTGRGRSLAVADATGAFEQIAYGGAVPEPDDVLDCGNSGTGARLQPTNTGLTEWEYEPTLDRWTLRTFNDTSHLLSLAPSA